MAVSERIAAVFFSKHPATVARLLESMDAAQASGIIESVPVNIAAPVLRQMLPVQSARCAAGLDQAYAASLLEHLPGQAGAAILRQLTSEAREGVLKSVRPTKTAALRILLRYHTTMLGAWMDPEILTLASDYSVHEARERLDEVDHAQSKIFVLDRDRRLRGAVSVHALRRSDGGGPINPLLEPAVTLRARETIVEAQKNEIWEHESHAALVNRHDEFVGVVSHADLRRGQRQTRKLSPANTHTVEAPGIGELLLTSLVCTWRNFENLLTTDVQDQSENQQ